MAGGEDFNEVVFDNVLVPKDRVVGEPGNGWAQVTPNWLMNAVAQSDFFRPIESLSNWCAFVAVNPPQSSRPPLAVLPRTL